MKERMKKILYLFVMVAILCSCSKDEETRPDSPQCYADLHKNIVPTYGTIYRILVFNDYVSYDIIYHNTADIEFTYNLADKLNLKLQKDNRSLYCSNGTDKIDFAEDGIGIVCRCADRKEKARQIYKLCNSADNTITENFDD